MAPVWIFRLPAVLSGCASNIGLGIIISRWVGDSTFAVFDALPAKRRVPKLDFPYFGYYDFRNFVLWPLISQSGYPYNDPADTLLLVIRLP